MVLDMVMVNNGGGALSLRLDECRFRCRSGDRSRAIESVFCEGEENDSDAPAHSLAMRTSYE